jgi:hypothetical protein
MKKFIVITTIYPKSSAIAKFEERKDWHVVVVADKKSPPIPSSEKLTFLSVEDQLVRYSEFARICPFNHYARKNIGYLYAIEKGAEVIYDTDDDNFPNGNWALPPLTCHNLLKSPGKYVNIYQYFTGEFIWPRGFPIDEIWNERKNGYTVQRSKREKIGVWQGLTNEEPDIDAIYRLIVNKKLIFDKKPSVYLNKNRFCPINSQNTFWNKKAFPFLYLPATVNFRFTDILRGYIAQYLMWHQDLYVGFTQATVSQTRNPHDLMMDYKNECDMYLHIKDILRRIENVKPGSDPLENLLEVYRVLPTEIYVHSEELELLKIWIRIYQKLVYK